MKKFISCLLTSGIFTLNMFPIKADTVYVVPTHGSAPKSLFSISDNNGTITWTELTNIPGSYFSSEYNFFDPENNKIYSQNWSTDQYSIYDIDSDTWTTGNNIGATTFDAIVIPSLSEHFFSSLTDTVHPIMTKVSFQMD